MTSPFAITQDEPHVDYTPNKSIAGVWPSVLNQLAQRIHIANDAAGWWPEGVDDLYMIPTKIALAHSELSEALEGHRKDLMDDKLPHRKMEEVEYADAIIRILDICGRKGYDIGGALVEKFNYNQTRADHKPENRAAEGGKKI